MEATDSPASWVYLGSWTQRAQGSVRGARLTLTDAGGAYLIAFLALFVRLAGQHSWGIVRFLAFHLRRRGLGNGSDAFHATSQSILRNTDIDNAAIWQFLKLARHSKIRTIGASGRYISWVILALVHTVAFLVAGIFVSRVAVSGSSEVLVRGPTCGLWQTPFAFGNYDTGSRADSIENNLFSTWSTHLTLRASQFTQQCYNTTSSVSALANCNAYAPSLVDWKTELLTSCPFEQQICTNGTAVRFDSGLLDSSTYFGINAKSSDRVKYRRVVECSPLARSGYVGEIVNAAQVEWSQDPSLVGSPPSDGQFQEYKYGPNFEYNMTSSYIWNNFSLGTPAWVNTAQSTYGLFTALSMAGNPSGSTFAPIPELNRTDADVILYFLTTDVLYLSEVIDPWFQATTVVESSDTVDIGTDASPFNIYGPDHTAGVVACTQQFQYCNHDASRCSPLTGESLGGGLASSIQAFSAGLELNPRQMSTLSRIVQASWNGDMWYVTFSGGGANLLAATIAATTWALPALPDNQWILEFQHYFLMGLTHMQMELAAYATGPAGQNNYQYITRPAADEEWMCSNQIVQRSGYMTFSVLGIVIVLVVGGVMMLANFCLPSIVNYLKTRSFSDNSSLWYQFHHLSLLRHGRFEGTAHPRRIKHDIDHKQTVSCGHDISTPDNSENPLVFTTSGKSFWRISDDTPSGVSGQSTPSKDYIQ